MHDGLGVSRSAGDGFGADIDHAGLVVFIEMREHFFEILELRLLR